MLTKKQMNNYYNNYCNVFNKGYRGLYHCYKNPSDAKKYAYADCLCIMHTDGGYNSSIISYNLNVFTFGYLYDIVNYNTKTKTTHFKVITKNHIGDIIVKTEEFGND